MNVTITRDYDQEVTEGVITDAAGKIICYTLELPWEENAKNYSCIPEGKYKYRKFFSSKFGRWVYRIDGVPDRSLVDIHIGNCVRDIEGCIVVGTDKGVLNWHQLGKIYPAVLHSENALNKLLSLLGSEGTITITSKNGEPK